MKRVMVILVVLLLAGLAISASGAFDVSSFLSGLNTPSSGASSSSVPASLGTALSGYSPSSGGLGNIPTNNLAVGVPQQSSFDNWKLNGLKFFSNDNHADATPPSSIPASDVNSIVQMLSQLPTSDQMAQYYGGGTAAATATPVPNTTATFQSVSTTIPDDQVIFIEVSRNTMLVDPTNQGMIIPNVTMNYKFSDKDKKLSLKKKAGADLNNSTIVFGFSDSDDVNNRYVFDYGIGSSPYSGVSVVFTGADGRVSVIVNGVQKDLKPGEKAESITENGGQRTVLDVTNWGLIPKSSIEIKDSL